MKRIVRTRAVLLLLALAVPASASAQLLAAKEGPLVYGHHHLNVSNVEESRQFWLMLGGAPFTFGTVQGLKLPNVLILLAQRAPTGGSKGSTADHIGLNVRDLRATLEKVRAGGYRIVTKEEMPAGMEARFDGDIAVLTGRNLSIAFVMGPEGQKVELVENTDMATPVALGHVHLAGPDVPAMRAWYEKIFGPKIPGVSLAYKAAADTVGTKGRVVDHVGFEVRDLEAFCKKLEAMGITFDRPYARLAAVNNLGLAFISDPWGTSIELTEGFATVE